MMGGFLRREKDSSFVKVIKTFQKITFTAPYEICTFFDIFKMLFHSNRALLSVIFLDFKADNECVFKSFLKYISVIFRLIIKLFFDFLDI